MNGKNLKHFVLGAAIVAVGMGAMAAIDLPAAFAPGEPLSAAKFNDYFARIKTAIDALQADGSVSTAKIADGAVTTAKVANGAVNAAKTADEPGFNTTFVAVTTNVVTTAESKASITLDAPAAGFIVVTANFIWLAQPTTGFNYGSQFNLSKTAGDMGSAPTGAQLSASLPTAGADNLYFQPISMTQVFTATAGVNTFHLNALWTGGTVPRGLQTVRLTAIYLPTRYGTGATVN